MNPTTLKERWLRQSMILMLLLLAAWLRLWHLADLPPGLWYDEAYNAMDVVWMLETKQWPVFLTGNNGREPMWHYLAALSVAGLGAKPVALRLVSAFVGFLTVPVLYRCLRRVWAGYLHCNWLALFGASGLALSYWHITLSRTGFRTILLPLFVAVISYLFWQGWQRRSIYSIGLAGVALGVSQYTYLSARLLPVFLGLFGVMSIIFSQHPAHRRWLRITLLVMTVVSAIVFAPLGLFFWEQPDFLAGRSEQVSIWTELAEGKATITRHLWQAVSIYFGSPDPNWWHDLPLAGHSGLGWLALAGFWAGVFVAGWKFRRPPFLFLLVGLGVMWLPGLLARPPIHVLRLSGMLPFFYALSALGWVMGVAAAVRWRNISLFWAFSMVWILFVVFSAGTTAYDYFGRWAGRAEIYAEYEGERVDLARMLIAKAQEFDILLPFSMYEHPATRFLLYDAYSPAPPDAVPAFTRPAVLVLPNQNLARRTNASSDVLLTRTPQGQGLIYFSSQPRDANLALKPVTTPSYKFYQPYTGAVLATLSHVQSLTPTLEMFAPPARLVPVNRTWQQSFLLTGYQLTPEIVRPGETVSVDLFWKLLTLDNYPSYDIRVDVVNNLGQVISQSQFSNKGLFSWRWPGAIASSRHLVFIGPESPSGPYLVQAQLIIHDEPQWLDGIPSGDVLPLGLFYVVTGDQDPRIPPKQVRATFANSINLLGYAPPLPLGNNIFRGKLFWQITTPITRNYTPFVRLLDADGNSLSDYARPPLGGSYPISHWRPGETIVDEFDVTLPPGLLPRKYWLVAGLMDPVTGTNLPPASRAKKPLPADVVLLEEITITGD